MRYVYDIKFFVTGHNCETGDHGSLVLSFWVSPRDELYTCHDAQILMIDTLKKIADSVQFLRLPCVALGLISIIGIATIIFGPSSNEEEFFAIPSAVGLLWSVTTYSFLVYFRAVPEKADTSWKFVKRLKRRIVRVGYWIMGAVFIATTIGAIFVSFRMITIWLRDYG